MENEKIYISYARGDVLTGEALKTANREEKISNNREQLVNDIENAFTNKGFTIVRNKQKRDEEGSYDIEYLKKEIGSASYVIVVFSEKFFCNSFHTIDEVIHIVNNLEKLKGRIFPVFTEDFIFGDNFEYAKDREKLKKATKYNISKQANEEFCKKWFAFWHQVVDGRRDEFDSHKAGKKQVKEFIDQVAKFTGYNYNEIDKLVATIAKTNNPYFDIEGVKEFDKNKEDYEHFSTEDYISRKRFNALSRITECIGDAYLIPALEENIEQIQAIPAAFCKSHLINIYDKFKFINEHKLLSITHYDYVMILSRLMKSTEGEEELNNQQKNNIAKYFKKCFSETDNKQYFQQKELGSFLIPGVYDFFSKDEIIKLAEDGIIDIEEESRNWIKKYDYNQDASFVIEQYLGQDGKLEPIKQSVEKWINRYQQETVSDIIIRLYLEKGGELDFVTNWINEYWNNKNASFVIKPYLEKDGELEPIKQSVANWINQYWNNKNASFVIDPYIKKDGELEPIKQSVANWINQYWNNQNASFVIEQYLGQGGKLEPIKQSVEAWIDKHQQETGSDIITELYLEKGGELDFVTIWINKYWNSQNSKFVIGLYFEKNDELEPIKQSVENWINKYWDSKNAGFIIDPYLKKDGELKPIKQSVEKWINRYQQETGSDIIIRLYLEKGGELDFVTNWINEYWDSQNASFVIGSHLKKDVELKPIKQSVEKWINRYQQKTGSGIITRLYLEKGGELDFVTNWINENWDNKNASFVIEQYIEKGGELEPIKQRIRAWIDKHQQETGSNIITRLYLEKCGELDFVKNWINEYWNNKNASFVIELYFEKGGKLEPIKQSVEKWINEHWKSQNARSIVIGYIQKGGNTNTLNKNIVPEESIVKILRLTSNIQNTKNISKQQTLIKNFLDSNLEEVVSRGKNRQHLFSLVRKFILSLKDDGLIEDKIFEQTMLKLIKCVKEQDMEYVTAIAYECLFDKFHKDKYRQNAIRLLKICAKKGHKNSMNKLKKQWH